MSSKKAQTRIKIFLFLLLTVGIVFLLLKVWWATRQQAEGFQLIDINTADCTLTTVNNTPTYLCESLEEAKATLLNAEDLKLTPSTAICYKDITLSSLTKADTVYYTCFDRPTPLGPFDPITGSREEIDPIADEDPQPERQIGSIKANCAAYMGPYRTIMNNYDRVITLISSVSTIGLANISTGMGTLTDINTRQCQNVPASDVAKTRVCKTIQEGIGRYNTIFNDTSSPISLKNTMAALQASKAMMSNEIFNTLKPAFLNSGCITEEELANYSRAF